MLCDLNAERGFVDRLVTDDAPPVAPSSVPIPYATAGRSTPVQLGSAALSAAPALVYEDIIGSPHSSDGPATPPHRPYPTFPPIGFERDVLLRVAAIDAANQLAGEVHFQGDHAPTGVLATGAARTGDLTTGVAPTGAAASSPVMPGPTTQDELKAWLRDIWGTPSAPSARPAERRVGNMTLAELYARSAARERSREVVQTREPAPTAVRYRGLGINFGDRDDHASHLFPQNIWGREGQGSNQGAPQQGIVGHHGGMVQSILATEQDHVRVRYPSDTSNTTSTGAMIDSAGRYRQPIDSAATQRVHESYQAALFGLSGNQGDATRFQQHGERLVQHHGVRNIDHITGREYYPAGEWAFMVGDWVCTACNYHNFRRNAVCHICHLPKEHNMAVVSRASAPPLGSEGDWQCECGFVNWRRRALCKKCFPTHPSNQDDKDLARRQALAQQQAWDRFQDPSLEMGDFPPVDSAFGQTANRENVTGAQVADVAPQTVLARESGPTYRSVVEFGAVDAEVPRPEGRFGAVGDGRFVMPIARPSASIIALD